MKMVPRATSSIEDLISKALTGDLMVKDIPDYSNRTMIVKVDPRMPWATDGIPMSLGCDVKMLRVVPEVKGSGAGTLLAVVPGQEGTKLRFHEDGLRLLGHLIGFRIDFIQKLPIHLQAEVINEVIKQYRSQVVQLSGSGNTILQISAGWRHLCSHGEVAQLAYNTLKAKSPEVHIDSYDVLNGRMTLKLCTMQKAKITAKQGDVLVHGIKVCHTPGVEVSASAYTKRLLCLNGMTSEKDSFPWVSQNAGSIQHQLDFLVQAINGSYGKFDQIVQKAKVMANTQVHGEPLEALMTRANSMKIGSRFNRHLTEAYQVEQGDTEWDMLNALTRFATHCESEHITPEFREGMQTAAGSWTAKFDMVTARMPQSIAKFVGAEIINN